MNPRMWTVLLVVLPNAFLCEELHQRSGWMCTQLLMSRRSFLYCNPAVSEDRCDVYHLNGCVKMKRWGRRAGVHFPGWHYSLHFSLLCAWPLRVSCLYKSLHCSAYFQNVILGFIIFLLYYSPPPPVDFLALDFLTVSCKRSDDYFLFAAMFLLLFKKAFIRALITRALLSFSPRVIHSFAVSWLLKHFLRGGLLGFVFPPF